MFRLAITPGADQMLCGKPTHHDKLYLAKLAPAEQLNDHERSVMEPQTAKEHLRFEERLPEWQQWIGFLVSAALAIVLVAEAIIESLWWFYLIAAALIFSAVWFRMLARITVAVDEKAITLTGPAWKREIYLQDVHSVSVAPDNGTNLGAVNWPVTTHERGNLTRLNMGGSVCVNFTDSTDHRYQFVLTSFHDAELVAEALTR